MELIFESTKKFEKDLASLPEQDIRRVVAALNQYGVVVRDNPTTPYPKAFQPHIPQLKDGLDATLYALRIGRDIRAILTVDDDPLFDQVIIRLLRVVRHEKLERAYKGLSEFLYQDLLKNLRHGKKSNG